MMRHLNRKALDGFGIALHHGHRNPQIMPCSNEVVIKRLHLNRIAEGMTRASFGVFVMPEHPAHHPHIELSAQCGIRQKRLCASVQGELNSSLAYDLEAFAHGRQRR